MMPWREGLVIALGLLVGGCFLPAYQIASWTATGVSYIFSGKGPGDHALSLAMHKDCATWRVLQGKEICVDYGRDFESSWDAMASTWKVPEQTEVTDKDLLASGPDDPVSDSTIPDTPTQSAEVRTTGATLIPVNVTESIVPKRDEQVRGIDFDGLVVPEWAVGPRQEGAWQPNAFAPRGLDLGGLVQTQRRQDLLAVVPTETTAVKTVEPAIYLVMGSFRDKENAERLGASYASIKTTVSIVENDGRTMYRLLAGPVEKASLTGLRVDLAKAGIRHSWAVKLCRGSLTVPPCQVSVQQAKLP